jgi:hypothetical protein
MSSVCMQHKKKLQIAEHESTLPLEVGQESGSLEPRKFLAILASFIHGWWHEIKLNSQPDKVHLERMSSVCQLTGLTSKT